jgi:NADH-quinone oxidoreductase subunit L
MALTDYPLLAWIPLLPLLGAAYSGFFGARLARRWGERAVHLPTVALPWASFVLALLGFIALVRGDHETVLHHRVWTWMDVGALHVDLAFLLDRLSAVMCLVVTFVGSLIHVYSTGYMRGDPGYFRFFSYLNLFMFSMLVLVLGDSLLLLFVGWEGVGLCSYLLISFWYTDLEKARAGMKAFVVNRIGDAGFVLGMFLLFWSLQSTAPLTGSEPSSLVRLAPPAAAAEIRQPEARPLPATSLEFRELERILGDPARRGALAHQRWLGTSVITLVCLLFFLGAAGKSAQLPLYVWLPDAMAGPTPVSALIHAATMVTAGVYLLARLHFLFALSPTARTVVVVVGALTALFAATIGVFQHDIKKVLAYSTVSQLGFMFVAVGAGAFWVGIFHLTTHAVFKACLFLGSGSVILGCHHEQDMRHMGGLRKLMPVTAVSYFLSCCAIAGFPFFSGFFSKDEILWKAFDSGDLRLPGGGLGAWLVLATAALLTSFYMFRSYFMTFSGSYRGGEHHHGHAPALPHESPRSMTAVLAGLGALAVVVGFVGLPHLWHAPNLFEHWLEPVFASSTSFVHWADHGSRWEWTLMGVSIAVAFTGYGLARWLYLDARSPIPVRLWDSQSPLVRGVHRVVYNKYYVDELYHAVLVRGVVSAAYLFAWIDSHVVDGVVNGCGFVGRRLGDLQGFIDRWFVDGLVNLVGEAVIRGGRTLRHLQTGHIQSYVWGIVTGSLLLMAMALVLPW